MDFNQRKMVMVKDNNQNLEEEEKLGDLEILQEKVKENLAEIKVLVDLNQLIQLLVKVLLKKENMNNRNHKSTMTIMRSVMNMNKMNKTNPS